ncbi:hypothetical protein RN001_002229 [Aquatica leii]|uniref:DNA-directed DNA polymerase n=1 Tax=Aquatica leii TaxID=1421715 RepID=A0AAN7SR59_9COLE|nr:hypothetical protein RN001_002229 [Aquatica leii]
MDTVSKLCKRYLTVTRVYFENIKTLNEINNLKAYINSAIQIVRKAIKNKIHKENILESPFSIETSLAYFKFYRLKLRQLKKVLVIKSGEGLSTNLKRNKCKVIWEDVESCFNNRIRTGFISNLTIKDPLTFLKKSFKCFNIKIKKCLKESLLKVNVILSANFIKPQTGKVDLKTFCTKNNVIDRTTNLKRWYQVHVFDKLATKLEEFAEKDSGWALHELLGLKVNVNKYDPLKVGYSTFVSVPNYIKTKHAVVNVKNDDPYCFLWSVVSALYPAKINSNRPSSYPHFYNVLNCNDIKFPITIKGIRTFEKLNKLSINLFCLENKKILPCSLSSIAETNVRVINLLMLPLNSKPQVDVNDVSEEPLLFHFTWIKNLSALLSKQLSTRNHKIFICERCLNYFRTRDMLEKHKTYCIHSNTCCVRLPKPSEKYLSFKNYRYQEKVPFVIYADLECILEKCNDANSNLLNTKSKSYQKHIPFSIAYYLKCSYDNTLSKFCTYRGIDCIDWFVRELKNIVDMSHEQLNIIVPMGKLNRQQHQSFLISKVCHICKQPFNDDQVRVRDHNHQTGMFRGAAHQSCNLNYKDEHCIPVVFHNMSGYDAHFIIKKLSTLFEGNVKLLPINKEKYISFTKSIPNTNISLRFIDSFRFMSQSLNHLSSNLLDDQKKITKFYCNSLEEFRLLNKKGIFPYDYVDSWKKLEETCLPRKEDFYSQLNDENISDEDYAHAVNVWKVFGIQNIGEYSDLYLKTDVLLLADVFETFRETCLKTYTLDPLHYYTAPGLTFDAMLKTTNISLELLTDIDMVMFVEKGIRGGVSQCSNRYAKANNKYMRNGTDSTKDSIYLMYFDVNNLYGAAMSQYLPYGNFEFMENFDVQEILNTPDDFVVGYIVECDLAYPIQLHNLHSDLPLAPEHMVPPTSKAKLKKLLLTLFPKERYVVHYRNLKMYLRLGMQLKKVHRVLKFHQSPWLKQYIDLNTKLRQQSKNDFEKDFYKLMINAIYGKCMENVRKHRDIRLVTKWDGQWGVRSLILKPNFHSSVVFDEDMVIIEMNKLEICMNKPIYVGFSILDISKIFYTNFIMTTL